MIRNYFTIAVRHLNKNRFYTLINIIGLTTGITACLVIFLFIRNELSYDRFHKNADRIVRLDWEVLFEKTHTYNAAVTPPMAEVIVKEYPEVEAAARFRDLGSFHFRKDAENLVEAHSVYADNGIFRVFTFHFVEGSPEEALTHPNTMVVTESCAARYFPNESALGKTLLKDNSTLYTITGVIKDLPDNSHFHFKTFLSMEGLEEARSGNWIGGPYNTYLLMKPGTDPAELEAKLPSLVNKHLMPYAASVLGQSFMDEFQKTPRNHLTIHVRPLTDIHLHSHLRNELEGNGDIKYVWIFGAIGIFILLIACINFMNLATARSAKRAREIGVRKVMGSSRTSLTMQFLMESVILSLFSFLIALGITEIALPLFNALTGLHLSVPYNSMPLVTGLLVAAVLVGLMAGVYPGFVISAFNPSQVLKGKVTSSGVSSFFHSGLVIFQFTISIFLTIATLALYTQVNYMRQADLGFNKEQLIRMKVVQNAGNRLTTFKEEMLANPMIQGATITSFLPGPFAARQSPLIWKYGATPLPENSVNIEKWMVDRDYVSTLGMQVISGRDFSRDFPSDSSAVIINEAALSQLGVGPDPIGQKLSLFHENPDGSQDPNRVESYTIIGVIKDFNFESLRQGVTPLGLFLGNMGNSITFRYTTDKTRDVIEALKASWNKIAPGEPFIYAFLDEDFEKMFNGEKKLGEIFVLFTVLAIIIASLGLFALTAYTAEQRTKEIGIRKVMGASVQQIVLLLSASFGRLVLIGFALAVPLAAIAIHMYLQQYAYRADVGATIYLQAGILSFLLAMFTMGYQSIKAAQSNPVDSLKHE
ncbi:MAG: ABC transporter permease [Bacteroidetes bacterium]|nr:ABC transporter permease [Bacteroidota bacterium]